MINKKHLQETKEHCGDSYNKVHTSIVKKYSKEIDNHIWDNLISISTDYDSYGTKSVSTVSKQEYDKVVDAKHEAQQKVKHAQDTINELCEGNEVIQRQLIEIDPHNIRYIRNPYVNIQLEAIMADSKCFSRINNPAQETIDMYRIVK